MNALPNVPRKGDPEQRRFDDAVRFLLTDMLAGRNRAVRVGDFESGAVGGFIPPELADKTIPPQVVNLQASGAFQNIILTWDYPEYRNHAFTRIYRGVEDDFAKAEPLANPGGRVFADPVGGDQSFYYWAANVSRSGVEGPINGVSGTLGETLPDLKELLDKLEGEVLESLLTKELRERINLIDAPATVGGSVAARIAAEAKKTADAIGAEALDRKDADDTNKYALDSLAYQMRGEYTGNDLSAVTHGLVASEREARKTETGALAAQVSLLSAGVAGTFDPLKTWYYDGSVEGWQGAGATLAYSTGQAIVTATAAGGGLSVTFPAVKSEQYPTLRARLRRTAGTGWDGRLRWANGSHGFSSAYEIDRNVTLDNGGWAVVEWDMSENADWMAGNVTGLQLLLAGAAGDTFAVDWVAIGRNGPAASVAQVLDEARVRAEDDIAQATARQTLSAKLIGKADPNEVPNLTLVPSGLLADERDARVTADKAEATKREVLSAKMLGTTDPDGLGDLATLTSGLLYEEGKARADAVKAEAKSRTELAAVVNTKNRTYSQPTPPAAPTVLAVGDIWYNTADNNQPLRWDGAQWVLTTDPRIPQTAANITRLAETTAEDKRALAQEISNLRASVSGGTGDLVAQIANVDRARIEGDQLTAESIRQLSVAIDGRATAIEQKANVQGNAITGFSASYTVKIDNAGRVAGYGLASDPNGVSQFNVLADRFAITIPGLNGGAPQVPFVAGVVDGVTRIVMSSAWIADGAIGNAKIGNAAIDNAKIANLDAAKITSGYINSDRIDVNTLAAKFASIETAFIKNANIQNLTLGSEKFALGAMTEAGVYVTTVDARDVGVFQQYADLYDVENKPVATTMNCKASGNTVLWFNVWMINSAGRDYDRFYFRVIRKGPNGNTVLRGEPKLGPARTGETFAWTFVDNSIPVDGTYTYHVQFYKTNGSRPQMDQMSLIGVQFKR